MLDRLTECDTWPESPANQNKCLWMLKHICISLKAQTNDCWPGWGQGFNHAQSTAVDTHLFTHAKCSLPLQTRAVHSQICKQTHTHNPVHSSNGNKRQTHNSIQRSPALAVAPIHTPIEAHTPPPLGPLQTVMMACVWEVNGCLLPTTFTLDYSSRLLSGLRGTSPGHHSPSCHHSHKYALFIRNVNEVWGHSVQSDGKWSSVLLDHSIRNDLAVP